MAFSSYTSWIDVLEDAKKGGGYLFYQAPLDRSPRAVHVVKVFKNGGIRLDPMSRDADKFTADAGHLSRFRRRT